MYCSWLRAQRAWHEQQLDVADRPPITRSNVVCAEPMPGERELLGDFVDQQFPEPERNLVQRLLEKIFDKMQLVGEAGSLLKIEEEIRDAIAQARRDWGKLAIQQQNLFNPMDLEAPGQAGSSLNADLQRLTKDFWVNIEERIYVSLRKYAEQAENSSGYRRRLFAEDAAQGFAFIDVCRNHYNVAVMNPPFGQPSRVARERMAEDFPRCNDIYAAFVERGLEKLTPSGLLGAITSRTGFFQSTFRKWREETLLDTAKPVVAADLGEGVLDAAMVETAAYCLEKAR